MKSVIHSVVVVKDLASSDIPLCGHDEKFGSHRNGKYMMLLEVIAQFDSFLASHIAKYGHPVNGNISPYRQYYKWKYNIL